MFFKKEKLIETVDCEICGCMVRKAISFEGSSEIRHRVEWVNTVVVSLPINTEFIYHPYFCRGCFNEKNQLKKEETKATKKK
jgi:hypothetical protein